MTRVRSSWSPAGRKVLMPVNPGSLTFRARLVHPARLKVEGERKSIPAGPWAWRFPAGAGGNLRGGVRGDEAEGDQGVNASDGEFRNDDLMQHCR